MARPGRPERNRAARSFRQLRRFLHVINSNKVFGTHREFERHGREVNVRVEGQLVLNSAAALLQSALQGLGLTYLTEGHVQPYLESGQLVRVLADCSRDTTSTIPAAGRRRRRSRY